MVLRTACAGASMLSATDRDMMLCSCTRHATHSSAAPRPTADGTCGQHAFGGPAPALLSFKAKPGLADGGLASVLQPPAVTLLVQRPRLPHVASAALHRDVARPSLRIPAVPLESSFAAVTDVWRVYAGVNSAAENGEPHVARLRTLSRSVRCSSTVPICGAVNCTVRPSRQGLTCQPVF